MHCTAHCVSPLYRVCSHGKVILCIALLTVSHHSAGSAPMAKWSYALHCSLCLTTPQGLLPWPSNLMHCTAHCVSPPHRVCSHGQVILCIVLLTVSHPHTGPAPMVKWSYALLCSLCITPTQGLLPWSDELMYYTAHCVWSPHRAISHGQVILCIALLTVSHQCTGSASMVKWSYAFCCSLCLTTAQGLLQWPSDLMHCTAHCVSPPHRACSHGQVILCIALLTVSHPHTGPAPMVKWSYALHCSLCLTTPQGLLPWPSDLMHCTAHCVSPLCRVCSHGQVILCIALLTMSHHSTGSAPMAKWSYALHCSLCLTTPQGLLPWPSDLMHCTAHCVSPLSWVCSHGQVILCIALLTVSHHSIGSAPMAKWSYALHCSLCLTNAQGLLPWSSDLMHCTAHCVSPMHRVCSHGQVILCIALLTVSHHSAGSAPMAKWSYALHCSLCLTTLQGLLPWPSDLMHCTAHYVSPLHRVCSHGQVILCIALLTVSHHSAGSAPMAKWSYALHCSLCLTTQLGLLPWSSDLMHCTAHCFSPLYRVCSHGQVILCIALLTVSHQCTGSAPMVKWSYALHCSLCLTNAQGLLPWSSDLMHCTAHCVSPLRRVCSHGQVILCIVLLTVSHHSAGSAPMVKWSYALHCSLCLTTPQGLLPWPSDLMHCTAHCVSPLRRVCSHGQVI